MNRDPAAWVDNLGVWMARGLRVGGLALIFLAGVALERKGVVMAVVVALAGLATIGLSYVLEREEKAR
jgi:hypothetical protein